MSDLPSPVSAARRRSPLPWVLLAITALAAGAWFFGDVPNRYRASQAMREGRVALLASDLPKALGFFRQAAGLRPTDEAIVRQYDETQARWIAMAAQQFGKLEARDAYLARRKLPDVEASLVEPHLGTYRDLIEGVDGAARNLAEHLLADAQEQWEGGNFTAAEGLLQEAGPYAALLPALAEKQKEFRAARLAHGLALAQESLDRGSFDEARSARQQVAELGEGSEEYAKLGPAIDEAEVRVRLGEAAAALAQDDFKSATAALAQAAEIKALPDDVKKAREQLQARAIGTAATELAVALARNDEAAVTAALAKGHEFAGWEPVPAAALLKPADLGGFLKALDAFGIGPATQAKYANRLDLPIVLYNAAKFSKDDVAQFTRDTFLAWSRRVAEQKLFGLALFLDGEARRAGAALDEAWRKDILAKVPDSAGVAIAVAPAQPDKDAPAGLNDAATILFKKALQGKLPAWPKLVEYDPAKPVTVVFSGRYTGYGEYDDDYSHVTTKTVRYQSGTRQVSNPEAENLIYEHNDLVDRYNQVDAALAEKENYVARVNNDYNASQWDKSQLVYKQIEIASDRRLLGEWNRQIKEMEARGRTMSMTIDEPVYSDGEYEIIDHVYTCSIGWQLSASLHGQEVDVVRWDAPTEFRTQEIRGEASHGVPVKAPAAVPKAKLLPGLVQDLGKKVGNVDDVIQHLPALTVQSFANFYDAHQVGMLEQANGFLTLLYAWESVGRKIDSKDDLIERSRWVLNLPAEEK